MIRRYLLMKYARSLAEVAQAAGVAAQVEKDFRRLLDLIGQLPDFTPMVKNPAIPLSVKLSILDELVRRENLHHFLASFLQILMEHHRMPCLPVIFELFLEELDRLRGVVKAQVATARALDDAHRQRLSQELQQLLNRQVELALTVDPVLLGGVRLTVRGTIYDGSVQRQLERLKEELSAR